MIPGKNKEDIIYNIKKQDPSFEEEDLLNYTEIAIKMLYENLKNNKQIANKIKCQDKVIEKICKSKSKYRIIDDIDTMSIQYSGYYDLIEKDNKKYIKVKLSIYFYDNTKNNSDTNIQTQHKYWNDIWIVTYENIDSNDRRNSCCQNCGATMNYDKKNKIFECEYCGNINLYTGKDINWEIIDIEVQ